MRVQWEYTWLLKRSDFRALRMAGPLPAVPSRNGKGLQARMGLVPLYAPGQAVRRRLLPRSGAQDLRRIRPGEPEMRSCLVRAAAGGIS